MEESFNFVYFGTILFLLISSRSDVNIPDELVN
jgi:hypothetical protein